MAKKGDFITVSVSVRLTEDPIRQNSRADLSGVAEDCLDLLSKAWPGSERMICGWTIDREGETVAADTRREPTY